MQSSENEHLKKCMHRAAEVDVEFACTHGPQRLDELRPVLSGVELLYFLWVTASLNKWLMDREDHSGRLNVAPLEQQHSFIVNRFVVVFLCQKQLKASFLLLCWNIL